MNLTREQIDQLIINDNVTKCSSKSITCSPQFKIRAVKQYIDEGKSARQVFRDGGFNLEFFRSTFPKDTLRAWLKIYKEKGIEGLSTDNRGRTKGGSRPTMKGLTDKEKIERLELTVAYQKEKILFLAKLRAKRKE